MASDRALYVVSDVHGHLDKLTDALESAGLIDTDKRWSGGNARLWFLGDLFDRGTDGSGIVALIMRLGQEADAKGGVVDSLLGNHEILMLGAQRFGSDELSDDEGNARNFDLWWHLNGGQDDDVAKLTEKQLTWLRNRPAITYINDHLLVHTDTTEYASYGRNINAVNRAIRKIVKSSDAAKWWALFRKLTVRHRFEAADGPDQAAAMLDFFGGRQLVHGHSTIPDRLGIPGDQVNGARQYCDDLVLCVDGGVYQGGPCLVVPLPVTEESLHKKADDDKGADASDGTRDGAESVDAPQVVASQATAVDADADVSEPDEGIEPETAEDAGSTKDAEDSDSAVDAETGAAAETEAKNQLGEAGDRAARDKEDVSVKAVANHGR